MVLFEYNFIFPIVVNLLNVGTKLHVINKFGAALIVFGEYLWFGRIDQIRGI